MRGSTIAIAVAAALALVWVMAKKRVINLGSAADGIASSKVIAFALAIAKAEGFYKPGSVPSKTNNPGDLKLPNTPATSGGITIFSTLEEGWAALYRQLELIISGKSRYYRLDMTIHQMGATYAPTGDNNIPNAWAKNVAAALGVPVTTTLRQVLT